MPSNRLSEIDITRGFDYRFMNAGILWGTGWAMVLSAGILALRLPSKLIGILGLALMAGHSFLAVAVDSTWWGTLILRSDELLYPLQDGISTFRIQSCPGSG
jgi:uncharacterized membrane protein